MANKIVLKKSSVGAKVPLTTDLDYGELALNYADEKLYFKNSSNIIRSFSTSGVSLETLTIGTGLSGTSYNGTSAVTIALANTAVVAGTYGSSTLIPSITVDAQGRITSATTNAITVGNGTLTLATSGTGLSGSASFSANQSGATTFTVTSNATNLNTASTIVARDASGNFTAGTITAALTGNASTATTLATARNINGVSFNGSADITVTAAAGTLSGTTLNSTVVSSSLTSLGTVTTGVWNAGAVTSSGNITNTGSAGIGGAVDAGARLAVVATTTRSYKGTSVVTANPASLDAEELIALHNNAAIAGLTFSGADARIYTIGVDTDNAIYTRANALSMQATNTINLKTAGTSRLYISAAGNVGINTISSSYNLQVNGSFAATTKSFVIDHPTKPDMKLRYGSLEGPENGVYVRGKLNGDTIELPEYWTKLVDPDSITVDLTPIGKHQKLYVKDVIDNKILVGNENMMSKEINCFYVVYAERCDVDKLEVEIVDLGI